MLIDAHQHFWTLDNPYCDWPTPDLEPIYRDYGPSDLEPLLSSVGIEKTVLVQAAPSSEETRALCDLCARHNFVAGVVGWIDFDTPHTALAEIPEFRSCGLVGVRPMLQAIRDSRYILNTAFDPVFEALVASGLAFDALIQPRHLSVIDELARRWPDLSIVIDHAAKPQISAGQIIPWQRDIEHVARNQNVVCKLSGLATEAGRQPATTELKPYTDILLETFGPNRLLWGSDWPVVGLRMGYAEWFELAKELTGHLSEQDCSEIFGGNAARIYQIAQEKQYAEQ